MIDPPIAPLDEDILDFVRRRAAIAPAPHEARGRVLASVEARVAALGGGGTSGSAGGSGSGPPPSAPIARILRKGWPLAIAFGLGGSVGALGMRTAMQRPPMAPIPRVAVPTSNPLPPVPASSVASGGPTPSAAAIRGSAETRPPPAGPASLRTVATSSDQLARERVLLDTARAALEQGDPTATLAAVNAHEKQYPRGLLVQEREAMAIRALLLLRRNAEARARAERFKDRFPDSLILPALGAAVDAAPMP